jgi:hypothetical protein
MPFQFQAYRWLLPATISFEPSPVMSPPATLCPRRSPIVDPYTVVIRL